MNLNNFNPINRTTITAFTRQMATLLLAGIPLVQTLDLIARGQNQVKFQKIIRDIKFNIEKGRSVHEALQKYPRYFNNLFCSLINVAEHSGTLDQMFDRLATYREKTEMLLSKIKKALYYPLGIAVLATGITVFLLIFVVPQFQNIFANFGASLPTLTRIVINLSKLLLNNGWLLFCGLSFSITSLILLHRRSKKFNLWLDYLVLQLPCFSNIIKTAIVARFARTLAIMISAGIPLLAALQHAKGSMNNQIYMAALVDVRERIIRGQTLFFSLQQTKLFPNILLQMVRVGEESGTLEKMLLKTAEVFERDVDNAVDGLSSLLEPIVMAVLGCLIGGLVIAMYLPIFQLGSVA